MTEKEILSHYNVNLELFDDDLEREALLHELGHIEHNPNNLHRNRELYEVQADRNMIHHLLKAELAECDNHENFNYVHFMEKYNLKTIANEAMVIEEYLNLKDRT